MIEKALEMYNLYPSKENIENEYVRFTAFLLENNFREHAQLKVAIDNWLIWWTKLYLEQIKSLYNIFKKLENNLPFNQSDEHTRKTSMEKYSNT